MKNLFYIFISKPVTAAMFFLVVAVVGMVSLFNLSVELSPGAEIPKLNISVSWFGVSPEAVEAHLTSPIEAELASIKGVKKISSVSTEGNASIDLEFHPDTDMDFALIEINEKLYAIKKELPYGVGIPRVSPYIPDDFKDLQGFITYTVSANENAGEIRKLLKENILLPLLSVNGVSNAEIRGGEERTILVLIDFEKAKQFGVTNAQISEAVDNSEEILSAGFIKNSGSQFFVKINNNISDAKIIEEQIVKNVNNTSIKIKDIGKVIYDYKEPASYYRINGKETVSLIIDKEPGVNTLKTAELVTEKMEELIPLFPAGYKIQKEIDKSENVRNELGELYSGAVFSLIIIILLLLIIFRKISYTIIILASIAYSLLFSFGLFYLFEITLNILTISAFVLGFGFMVDNSIVVIDYLDKFESNDGIKKLAVRLKDIFFPVFASTLTTIAVFLPLLFLTGELRVYFEQFALGIVFTLAASLIVSFTIIPALYIKFKNRKAFRLKLVPKTKSAKNKTLHKKSFFFKSYFFLMKKIIAQKKIAFLFLILLIGLPVWLLPSRIETPVVKEIYNPIFDSQFYSEAKPYVNYAFGGALNLFFNQVSRGELWKYNEPTFIIVRLNLPHGNEISRINRLTKNFEEEILVYRDRIKTLTANVFSEENAYLRVEFDEKQNKSAFPYILKNYLSVFASRIGGLNVSVYGFGPGFSSGGGTMISNSVIVKGFNYERIKEIAEEYREMISKNPRIDNIDIDRSLSFRNKDMFEIVGIIDRQNLVKNHISVDEIFNTISKSTRGNISHNKFSVGNDEISYSIKYDNYDEIQLDEIKNAIISANGDGYFKVGELINFEEKKVLSAINREDQQYARMISFDYKGPYKYGKEFVDRTIENISIPEGYTIAPRDFQFMFGKEEEAEILWIIIIAAILIFMISASLFESLKKPFLIISILPFAVIGVIFVFYFTENSIDRGAYAGMLLLIGLAVNNSIILVDYLSKHLNSGSIQKLIELSYDRLRPIVTTTLTTAGALLPLWLGSEAAFWKSLSISVIGGISLSALITVFFIPLFYTYSTKIFKD